LEKEIWVRRLPGRAEHREPCFTLPNDAVVARFGMMSLALNSYQLI
jgi:hypothetical protein